MVRVFSLLIALAATVQSANAALLASWNFNTDASGALGTGVDGTASAFTNSGPTPGVNGVTYGNNGSRQSGGFWRTSLYNNQQESSVLANRFSYVDLTNTGTNVYLLDGLNFKAKATSGTASRGVKITVSKNGGAEVDVGSYLRTGAAFTTSSGSFEEVLRTGDTLRVFFRYFKAEATTTQRQLDLDDIELTGEVVPEPASLAVFGLVGAGLAIARRRKK